MSVKNICVEDDCRVDVFSDEVPALVRQAALKLMRPGDTLWRCPRLGAAAGMFGSGGLETVIEWWLLDIQGDLIEVFWEM